MNKYTIYRASAGTGKTYTLSRIIREHLASGKYSASQMIATTFTKKAAGELEERLRGDLITEGKHELARDLSDALIGTVNSVSERLIRQFPIQAGISPVAQTMSEEVQAATMKIASAEAISIMLENHRGLALRNGFEAEDRHGVSYISRVVRNLVMLARTNNITADELRTAHAAKAQELLTSIMGSTTTRDFAVLIEKLDQIRNDAKDVSAQLKETGETKVEGASELNKRNLGTVDKFIEKLDDIEHGYENKTLPWKTVLATTTAPERVLYGKYGINPDNLVRCEEILSDARQVIDVIYSTAAEVLVSYQEHKNLNNLIDFNDQEVLALKLLDMEEVREEIREQYRFLAVDEFQDTNPLQLAIFTKLGELMDEVMWVGDEKQAIYGFRGSDAELMDRVVTEIETNNGVVEKLQESWRTLPVPLTLSNALFSKVFTDDEGRATGTIRVAEKKVKEAEGGLPKGIATAIRMRSKDFRLDAGIIRTVFPDSFPENDGEIGKDLAVLCRGNGAAANISAALSEGGIICSGRGKNILATREGQIISAALKRLNDKHDRNALLELVALLRDHPHHEDWPTVLSRHNNTSDAMELLAQDDTITKIDALRPYVHELSMAEIVTQVIALTDLRRLISSWSQPLTRIACVDSFIAFARIFDETCAGKNTASVLSSFIRYYTEQEDAFHITIPNSPGTVYVDTIHSAKGLEWDNVLVNTSTLKRSVLLDPWIRPAENFTMSNPLNDRYLLLLPCTFSGNTTFKEQAELLPEVIANKEAKEAEELRISYVAFTRSASHTAFTQKTTPRGFSASPLMPVDDVETSIESYRVDYHADPMAETAEFDLRVIEGSSVTDRLAEATSIHSYTEPGIDSPTLVDPESPRGRRVASLAVVDEEFKKATTITDITGGLLERLVPATQDAEWNTVGDAVHLFLAAPLVVREDAGRAAELAEEIVANFGIGDKITADVLITADNRWRQWLKQQQLGTDITHEVPFSWRAEDGESMHGYFDELIKASDGSYVVVDHKSYTGESPEEKIREQYLGQMQAYSDSIADASMDSAESMDGHRPRLIMHMPLVGKVFEITLP